MGTGRAVPSARRRAAGTSLDAKAVNGLTRSLPECPEPQNSDEVDRGQDEQNDRGKSLTATGNNVRQPSGLARG